MVHEQQALFKAFALPFVGAPVTHAWRGHGSSIFLEFGALTPRIKRDGSPGDPSGEMSLMIEWGWRIEGKRSILCGCSSDEHRWPKALACLTRATVVGVTLFGRLPEIDLALSSGVHVVSLMTAQGNPAWTLFDRRVDVSWICVQHRTLVRQSS